MRALKRCVLLLSLLAGCSAKPVPPPTVADLKFPVVVLYGTHSEVLFKDAADLGTMGIGHLNNVTEPPPLIDSSFAIYTLNNLGSTHNWLWLMANPTGSTPVKFELERRKSSGIEVARSLLKARLEAQTWRDDLEQSRQALQREQTLAGMFLIVGGTSQSLQ